MFDTDGLIYHPRFPVVVPIHRFALGTLVQARERELMAHWAELLRNTLLHRSDACLWLLSELGRFPTILKELMLSPEDSVRHAAAVVAGVALRKCMLTASGAGDGGRPEDGNDDAYRAAYLAAAREQEEEYLGWQGGEKLAQGFVGVGQEDVDVGAEAEDDDARLARKTVRVYLVRSILFACVLPREPREFLEVPQEGRRGLRGVTRGTWGLCS